MILIKNANNILLTELRQNSLQADYEALRNDIKNGWVTHYVKDMQSYICKLSLVISRLCEDISVKSKYPNEDGTYYRNAVKFLCEEVICNKEIGETLSSLNDPANDAKHSTKSIEKQWILKTLPAYNDMIKQIIYVSKLNNLNMCLLKVVYDVNEIDKKKPYMCYSCHHIFNTSTNADIFKCTVCNNYFCSECYSSSANKCRNCAEHEELLQKKIQDIQSAKNNLEIEDHILLAEQGNKDSLLFLSEYYMDLDSKCYDFRKGIHYLIDYVNINKSDAESLFRLGTYFSEGKYITKDKVSSDKYYSLAKEQFEIQASNNSLKAIYMLGLIYEHGFSCQKDKEKAASYYLRAANQGYPEAEFKIGYMYKLGDFFPINLKEAEKNLRSASLHGSYDALRMLYDEFKLSKEEYIDILERPEFSNNKQGIEDIEKIYEENRTEKNIVKLYKLAELSNDTDRINELEEILTLITESEAGNPKAMFELRQQYLNGFLVLNSRRAFSLLKKSAKNGYASAQYEYAQYFKDKISSTENSSDRTFFETEYKSWIFKSLESGFISAKKECADLLMSEGSEKSLLEAYRLYTELNETERINELKPYAEAIERVVENPNPKNQYSLWKKYGVKKSLLSSNKIRENELLKNSADGEIGQAQYQYALRFKSKNKDKYSYWLYKAIQNGISKAKLDYALFLAENYRNREGLQVAVKFFDESYQEKVWNETDDLLLSSYGSTACMVENKDLYDFINSYEDPDSFYEMYGNYLLHRDDFSYSYKIADFFMKIKRKDFYVIWLNISALCHLKNFEITGEIPEFELANFYASSKAYKDALYWYDELCKYKYIPAMIKACFFYNEGKGCVKNNEKVLELYKYISSNGSIKEKLEIAPISIKLKVNKTSD